MDILKESPYLRMEVVIYIKMQEGETQEDAEDRFLCGLPEGMDCASFKSQYWVDEDE